MPIIANRTLNFSAISKSVGMLLPIRAGNKRSDALIAIFLQLVRLIIHTDAWIFPYIPQTLNNKIVFYFFFLLSGARPYSSAVGLVAFGS